MFTYIAPLLIILIITLTKEAYDDYLRWKRDKEVNNQRYKRISENGIVETSSSDIKVGQILQIFSHERIPADMILLKTQDDRGNVFVKTDQLDGETDWKLRKSVMWTQKIADNDLLSLKAFVTVTPPEKNIYSFTGRIESLEGDVTEGLNLENTLWANTTLASGSCIGIVIYTGKETRSVMNSREPSNKLGITDVEVNELAIYLVILMLSMSLILLSLSGLNANYPITLFRYLLLLTNIVPVSLRVNLDFAKIYYCYNISIDESVGKAKPRNRTIPEELGRIHYLLTDKTGTLTKNEMVLKIASLENKTFNVDDNGSRDEMIELTSQALDKYSQLVPEFQSKKKKKKDLDVAVKDFVVALALCNNVTPTQEGTNKIFQASSPDEIALVEFAQTIGVELCSRSNTKIVLKTSKGKERFKILDIFPFTSSTKRMGIILYHKKTNRYIFYLKGADEVIKDKIGIQVSQTKMAEDCETHATEGLRTLAITQRLLTPEEYNEFRAAYTTASGLMENRESELRKIINSIEVNMEYLGVTGVEDKLQDNVDKVIGKLNSGGIKIWMLTGDKVETAKCIAISTGLKKRDNQFYEFIECKNTAEVKYNLEELKNLNYKKYVVIIDGQTLDIILKSVSKQFIKVCSDCAGVIFSRVSPTQKSQIVEVLKNNTFYRICTIGDGGNDVGMIQSAHVGIGVEGKEGHQASLAADFSISEFKYLSDLILWHGRLSYIRTAKLANFIFHRGMIISVIQFIFIVLFYYSALPVYNGYMMLGYSTIFTSLPVFALVLDVDFDKKSIDEYPVLYKTVQMGRALNITRFLLWMFKSLYQGSVIILLSILLFPQDNFINIVAITFSALILTELLNVFSQIHTWTWLIVIAELSSLAVYWVCIILLKNYFNLRFIIRLDFFWKVLIITTISWLPVYLTKCIKERIWPPKSKQIQDNPY
jgi:phospholipid-translocating ATPase